ncbi:Tetratricopeptide repeat-domain-containing protein [Podospora fimiseda]|uniref:Tetratricopeptide repeat-domain-containing protein n=1 Tax=Podospora fimiseda TaxID=252190 RepID=A0AAN6YQK5_9PEZI|nr:Tetratricopeptide repeat-domain-containing protein [Podospora fimiseda]
MHRQALQLREKVLCKEHPSTLTSMNNLALVLGSQGKYEEAEKMHRQALQLFEKVLGKKHSSTLSSMRNLAGVLNDQGKYKEAEQMLDSLEFIIWELKFFQRFLWPYDIY